MPTFGSSTIRRFATNASEMKKLAARDFEDLLQVRSTISGMKKKRASSNFFFSAVSRDLKDCCQSHIIQLSRRSNTYQHHAMRPQHFCNIRTLPYRSAYCLQRSSVD